MAEYRQVKTTMFKERWFMSLSQDAKYLLLYCKLNPRINTAGFFQLRLDMIAFESGLSISSTRKALDELLDENLIAYQDEWLVVRGGNDGQPNNVKIKAAIDLCLEQAPLWVGEYVMGSGGGDARASHPAISAVREISDRYPRREDWDQIIEVLGEDFDVDRLIDAWEWWASKGYNPLNAAWITDIYVRGTYGRKRTNSEILRDYA